jgi:CelD/BcsL family acetyltransferase involved in cellulose biosynthesis
VTATALESHDDVAPIEREWDELADRVGVAPFLRPGWTAAWLECFAPGPPFVAALRRDGELAALVPLYRRGRTLHSASNEHTPQFDFLAIDDGAAGELARALLSRRATRLVLDFADADGPGLRACRGAAAAAGYRTVARVRLRSPHLAIETDWETYVSGLRRKPRYEVERRLRRLRESGSVTIEIADGGSRLRDLLDEGFRIEAAGWKGDVGTAIEASDATRSFYSGIARWAASRGWLRLAFLRLDGHALAFVFALEEGRTFYVLKEGFDPEFRRFGPGAVLRTELVSRAFGSGLERYEFLGADEPWKLEWTTSCHERMSFAAFPPSIGGAVQWAVQGRGRDLARRTPLRAVAQKVRGYGRRRA